MPRPVDIYIRVSRVGGREHLISPEEQERDARGFAARRGLKVGQVFTDLDRSGGTLERPGLQTALDRVRAGKSGGIVVAYLSRLTRETSQGLRLIEEIREAGGDVYAPNLSDHTTADGRMLNTIQLAIDAGMRERAKEGLARARERAIVAGIPVTNRDAVGYRRNPETRRYEPCPDVAPIVREVFERRAAGAGPTELGELLERKGVRTSQGSATWSKAAVQNLLASRTYLGEVRSGEFVNPNAHEPIVDQPLWHAAQHPNPAPSRYRNAQPSWLLRGLVRCRSCGYAMTGTTTSRGKRIYRCTVRHAGGRCPVPARVSADTLERVVVEQLFAASRVVLHPESDAPDLTALEAALATAERRLTQALAPEAQDALGETWTATVRQRRADRDEAAKALGQARAEAGDDPEPIDLEPVWDDVDPATRREILARRFGLIVVARTDEGVAVDVLPRRGIEDAARRAGLDLSALPRRGYRREPTIRPL